MRGPHNIWRLMRTGATFERTGAMQIVLDKMDTPKPIRITARVLGWPFRWLGIKGDPNQPPLVRALVALGPAYIKFGQLLSTRPDLVGTEMANELSVLQDRLPAFDQEKAIAIVEAELEAPISAHFSQFNTPIAAASLAQVHKATTLTGEEVAVKILRPNIERAFMRDVDAFHFGASMVEFLSPKNRRLRPKAVIEHFEHVVRNELDLRMEASVGNEYAENTKDDPQFHVPKIYWSQSSRRVLTTAWLNGIPLSARDAIQKSGVNNETFASLILDSFLTQALRDGLFHGDMHQGNLQIMPDGGLGAIDFGIMGRVDAYTRRVYAEILYGFLNRDYQRVADVHFEAGYVPADQDRAEFAQALRSVGEPIFGQDAENISMARLLAHLFEITETFGMQTRTELILLQRTMVVVEGVSRSIDPDINIWETARPAVEHYIRTELGAPAMMRDTRQILFSLSRLGPRLPEFIDQMLTEKQEPSPPQKPWGWMLTAALLSAGATALIMSLAL